LTDQEFACAEDVLTILQKAAGQYVSGEYLSKCLGVTRSAVWKRIAALKKEGYSIEASTKKGYRLNQDFNAYGKHAVQNALVTNTLGRELKYLNQIDSTNILLKQLALEGAPEGTTVIADSQTAGRGRLGRNWMSEPGNGIWMSVLLMPQLHPTEVQTLTLAASVAVCKALEPLKIKGLGIKWPNDILINGKKVCGILTELSAEDDRVVWVILGIGLNVNHVEKDFPPELSSSATSLRLNSEAGGNLDRSRLAAGILNNLEEVYNTYLQKGSSWVAEEWRRRNLTLGRMVRLTSRNEDIIAMACDILPDGRLRVKKEDGAIIDILSGEISLRKI
jgi:BirA family biotin operon repressor/biotin-[acetyl-CoA-carboxylase] ligase